MALSVLTTDETGVANAVNDTWTSFLSADAINSPITIQPATTANTPPNFVATPARFFNLKFSTDANTARFDSPLHFYTTGNSDTILLALEQKIPWSGPLNAVLQAFTGDTKVPGKGVVSKILTALLDKVTGEIPMTLVNPEGNSTDRNAMWCVAGQTRVTSTALVFVLDLDPKGEKSAAFTAMKDAITKELDIDIGDLSPLTFHMQRTVYGIPMASSKDPNRLEWSLTEAWSMTIQVTISGFNFWLQQDSGETSVILTQNQTDNSTVWDKLANLGSKKTAATRENENEKINTLPPTSDMQPSGPDIPDEPWVNIDLLSISLGKNLSGNFWWKIKTVFFWKPSPPIDPTQVQKPPVLIGLSYDSIDKSFTGELLTRKNFQFDKTLVNYRPAGDVKPSVLVGQEELLKDSVLLSDLFPEADSLPDAIPNAISVARISYSSSKSPAQSVFSIQASLVRAPKPDSSTTGTDPPAVPCPFTWESLTVYAQRVSKPPVPPSTKKGSSFAFGAGATFTLTPRKEDAAVYPPAHMAIQMDYNDGDWRVQGRVQDVNFGVLAGFMDTDKNIGDAAMDILGRLTLTEMDVLFTYSKDKKPASFLITGTITLGALELRLFYQYVGANATEGKTAADSAQHRKPGDPVALKKPATGGSWQLRAYLGAAGGKKATLGEIIDSIAGEGEGSEVIPEFVQNIPIEPAANGANSAVSLEVGKKGTAVVFVLSVNVMGIKFSYMQIGSRTPPPTAPGTIGSVTTTTPTGPQTTRLLRISVDKLPLIKDIPLVSTLGQPFDKLLYLYVSGNKGLMQRELDSINETLTDDKLLFKRAVAKPSLTNPVINKGHHFMVVQDGGVVLDHVFQIGKDETKPAGGGGGNSNKVRLLAAPVPEVAPSNPASKGSLTKSLGPLTISAITLEYKSKRIYLTLDATFTLGPISLTLLGFSIGILTTGLTLNNLSVIATEAKDRLSISLRGMSIAFDKPPILIAGGFEHEIYTLPGTTTSRVEAYRGGVGIGFPPYTFIGVGEYSDVTLPDGRGSYKSIFLFAKLDGPLVTLEFATISGVRLGFGFNSIVRSPRIDELTEFPFIKSSDAAGAGRNPMAILASMTKGTPGKPAWVTPREGSYWLAAGMTISSFEILAITAVAMFAFRDSGVVISIFADAVAQLPPHVPPDAPPGALILYVEIGMVAELNLIDGYFRVEAALAPTSYLLVPQCRLTGGFALCYWFGNNPNAGEYVFSIGGYHRAFKPPPYYPVPTRLGISFVIGDNIQMRGESYFAITPKAAMAGALIHISLSVGPVSAYLDASFDALINFHPFHYVVEFSVSVGVECDIDILFIHIHISIHIGADLHIEGPEFGGIAHVDFWFFGFDIEFGARQVGPPPLNLFEFWESTHQPGPKAEDRADVDPNPVTAKILYDDNWKPEPPPPKPLPPPAPGLPAPPVPPPQKPKEPVLKTPEKAAAAFKFVLEDGNFPMPASSNTSPTPQDANRVPSTGAGAKWFVKGGSFRLGITTSFALSHITIVGTTDVSKNFNTKDTGTIVPNPWGDFPDGGKMPTGTIVYSSPMHVTSPISSILTITVRRRKNDVLLPDPINLWRDIVPTKKEAPVAMWGKYDRSLDITALGPRGRAPTTLLDGTSKGTVSQTLGVSFSAPWPKISLSKIPKFQASAMARLGVKNNIPRGKMITVVNPITEKEEQVPQTIGVDWFIPEIEDVQVRFLGRVLTTEEKKLEGQKRWDKFAGDWKGFATAGKGWVDNFKEPAETGTGTETETGSTPEEKEKEKTEAEKEAEEKKTREEEERKKKEEAERKKKEEEQQKEGLLSQVASVFGWNVPGNRPVGEEDTPDGERPPWLLKGAMPKKLADGLTEFYLGLPRVCV
ncbi:hypothetical protein V8F20_001851 [Naviculisporaceae sp. PSN 640]